jgi:hypothetical protein
MIRIAGLKMQHSAKREVIFETVLMIQIRDPGSCSFFTPGSGIGDGHKSKSGSGVNIPDHISEILETIFQVKILKFFAANPDPGSGIFLTLDPGWKESDPGSGINIPDPQHFFEI